MSTPQHGHVYAYDGRAYLRPATEADRAAAHLNYDPRYGGPGIASPVFYSKTDGCTVIWDSRSEAFPVLPGGRPLTIEEKQERADAAQSELRRLQNYAD